MFYKELGINPKKPYMITFVGGGGKTSHMFKLANELKRFGNVLVTTTTKILLPDENSYDYLFVLETDNLTVNKNGVTLLAQNINENKKLSGVDKYFLDDLYEKKSFKFILIEADGAKEKPLKAPNDTEPIIPLNTNINIGIIGVDALDKKVEEVCFRENLFKNITKKDKDEIVDDNSILSLISHDKGLFKDTPKKCKKFFIISKCDNKENKERALKVLDRALSCSNIDRLFLSSVNNNFINRVFVDVCGIIMASGLSRRMGKNKLLMKVENESMIERIVKACVSSNLKKVIVVYNKIEVKEKIKGYNLELLYNKNPEVGQSMSIKLGLDRANRINPKGYMFLVGDQPFIQSKLINSLLSEFIENNENIIIPKYREKNGNPVVFPKGLSEKFNALQGDSGGREIIKKYDKIKYLKFEDDIQGFDIDTKEDYEHINDLL